jgi:HEAT repeat protein
MNDDEIRSCLNNVAASLGLRIKSLSRRPLSNVWQIHFVDSINEVKFVPSPQADVEECTRQFKILLGREDPSDPGYVERNVEYVLRRRDPDDILSAMDRLTTVGEKAVDALLRALLDRKEPNHARSRAAETLAMIGDSRAIEPLIQILNEPDAFLRWSAVKALEKIGDERAVLPLERLATDDAGHFSITPDLHMSVDEAARKALRTIKERMSVVYSSDPLDH